MNTIIYVLKKEEQIKNKINEIVKHEYELNINHKKKINITLVVKVNEFDVKNNKKYIETEMGLMLIDNFYTVKHEFNDFKDLDDLEEFMFSLGIDCKDGFDEIKHLKSIADAIELDLNEEEFQLCREVYSEGGEEEYKKVEDIINKNFTFIEVC